MCPDRSELHVAALRAARTLWGDAWLLRVTLPASQVSVYEVDDGKEKKEVLSVILRNFKGKPRDAIGIQRRALRVADQVWIYLYDKACCYLIPSEFLRAIFDSIRYPTVNNDQWYCNLNTKLHQLETKGLYPPADLRPFVRRLERSSREA